MTCRSLTNLATACLSLMAAACLNDSPVSPTSSGVRLSLNAQIEEAGQAVLRRVRIRIFYYQVSQMQVDLPSSPGEVTVEGGTTTSHDIAVQIGPCLRDPDRVRGDGDGCYFIIELALLDDEGQVISEDAQEAYADGSEETLVTEPFFLGAQREMIVIEDSNILDDRALQNQGNVNLTYNLALFAGSGPRAASNVVQLDCGRAGQGVEDNSEFCTFDLKSFRAAVTTVGMTVRQTASTAGTLTNIAGDVKVLILVTPCQDFTLNEVNTIREFAAQGGRVVLLGEWTEIFGPCRDIENRLLMNMGSSLRSIDAALECDGQTGAVKEPAIRSHQITEGVASVTAFCAAELELGTADQPILLDRNNTRVFAAATPISTSPLASPLAQASHDAVPAPPVHKSTGATRSGPAAVSAGVLR
jgi:hypothetical protein